MKSSMLTKRVTAVITLRSEKATHFTGAIIQNAKEDENIGGLASNRIRIHNISLQAKENLDYRVILWGTDGFDDTDLDADTFQSEQEFDLPTYGWRIGAANQYYMNLAGVEIDYEDKDFTNELHISLECLSAAGKTAGANGQVVVQIDYSVRD